MLARVRDSAGIVWEGLIHLVNDETSTGNSALHSVGACARFIFVRSIVLAVAMRLGEVECSREALVIASLV